MVVQAGFRYRSRPEGRLLFGTENRLFAEGSTYRRRPEGRRERSAHPISAIPTSASVGSASTRKSMSRNVNAYDSLAIRRAVHECTQRLD